MHASLSSLTASLDEVARAMGLSPQSLKRRHRKLHDEAGFPLPLPGGGWVWSRPAVESWMHAGGEAVATANDNDTGIIPAVIAAQTSFLTERYAKGRL